MAKAAQNSTAWLWFLDDATTPKYTAADVERLTGASSADLQNWANRGLIKPKSNRPGKGGRRLYTKQQACVVAVRQWLRPLGMDASYAFEAAIAAIKALIDPARILPGDKRSDVLKRVYGTLALLRIDNGGRFAAEVARAEEGYVVAILERMLSGDPALLVPVGNIVGQVQIAERAMLNSEASA